jgi:UDP-N-acetylmuramoyl-L-alanyl-D-glutamate--2,6-diaminopimelate ligase
MLGRVDGLRFDGGLLAAIMPGEHTNFHRSYEDYVEAKRLFLAHLEPTALLAYDADNLAARLVARGRPPTEGGGRSVGFSIDGREAELTLSDIVLDGRGATFFLGGALSNPNPATRIKCPLLGRGHLRNVALALTYALGAGLPVRTVEGLISSLTPLRRRMERYEVAGRTFLDDTAAHPNSLQATFEVASLLPRDKLAVVYALRGSRGVEINRQNASAIADLCSLYGADPLIVTSSSDETTASDAATPPEIDAARQALVSKGRRFAWHDALGDAAREALERTLPGDLLVLVGAQGMNEGKKALRKWEG